MTAEVALSYAAREALAGGRLLLRVYRNSGVQDIKLELPK